MGYGKYLYAKKTVHDILTNACYWEYNISGGMFQDLFGKDRGAFLWRKFHDKNHSILALWVTELNRKEQSIVADEISAYNRGV